MPTQPLYHTQQYAAALDELNKAPVISLPPLITFTASVFALSYDEVLRDVLAWTEAA